MTTDTKLPTKHEPATTTTVPDWTPPRWVNATVKAMLHTPAVQRFVGRAIATITVTGRHTGRRYTLPVTYDRTGGTVLVLTKRFRTWWRNLDANPEVELRLAGRDVAGHATLSIDDPTSLPDLVDFLEHRKHDARAYGITLTPEGDIDPDEARALLSQIVILRIELDSAKRL
jgi:hypothetical protein